MKSMTIVGCGKLGLTLAVLFKQEQVLTIHGVLNQTLEKSKQCVVRIGEGVPTNSINTLASADVYLISTPDEKIAECTQALVDAGHITSGTIVFHCSGALGSSELGAAKQAGAYVASVHPIKSFADTDLSVASFQSTHCGIEGDRSATLLLTDAFTQIGATIFPIIAEHKIIYHAAAVMACNNLVALMELSLKMYETSGVPRRLALQAIESFVKGTIDNIFKLGTEKALTGPIVRGDAAIVKKHIEALAGDPLTCHIYKLLGQGLWKLAKNRGEASEQSLEALEEILSLRSAL